MGPKTRCPRGIVGFVVCALLFWSKAEDEEEEDEEEDAAAVVARGGVCFRRPVNI